MESIVLVKGDKLVLWSTPGQFPTAVGEVVLITSKSQEVAQLDSRPPWNTLYTAQDCTVKSGIFSKRDNNVVVFDINKWNSIDDVINKEISLCIVQNSNSPQICILDNCLCCGIEYSNNILRMAFTYKKVENIYE